MTHRQHPFLPAGLFSAHTLVVGLVLAGLTSLMAYAQTGPVQDYKVEAAFLVNFAHFIAWPEQSFTNATTPFMIGVLDDDRVCHVLAQMVGNETVGGRRIVVKSCTRLNELTDCRILFIGRSERARLSEIFGVIGTANVLTVGETDSFTELGGIINFIITSDNKIRFRLHLHNATRAGLKIDGRLLKVAQLVASSDRAEER